MQLRSNLKSKQSGFTLIEVLLAVIVIALVAVMVSQTTSTAARQLPHTEARTYAAWVANDRLAALRVAARTGQNPGEALMDKQVTETFAVALVSMVTVQKSTSNLDRVEVVVYSADNTESPIYRTTGYVANYGGTQ